MDQLSDPFYTFIPFDKTQDHSATFTPEPGDPNQGHLEINGIERVGRSRVSDARATEASFNEMRTQLRAVERWAESRLAPATP